MLSNPFARLLPRSIPKPFDCGIEDLNEFFLHDAQDYQKKLLAVTYYIESADKTIAFFTLSNDKISADERKNNKPIFPKSFFRKLKDKFDRKKHRSDYPAVKIGRFGVHKSFQNTPEHWGSLTLDFIKHWMITDNKTGCCFITVDAYAVAVEFYRNNGFRFMGTAEEKNYMVWSKVHRSTDKDTLAEADIPTFAMYFNLLDLAE